MEEPNIMMASCSVDKMDTSCDLCWNDSSPGVNSTNSPHRQATLEMTPGKNRLHAPLSV
ncbi:hypothetical protein I79_010328 [Cricetulus griseus]|uniref:Uncharacterized protein n=1 Tax=Cricetulus griseus TaxID=10029 RepID=G3HI61_CRIGR|nr:hypothetical protein I79_010328 [Cricetulus griseus]